MEQSESYAILDINIYDKDSEKTENNDNKKKTPLTTVIKIRKLFISKRKLCIYAYFIAYITKRLKGYYCF